MFMTYFLSWLPVYLQYDDIREEITNIKPKQANKT